jgi:hypothetical protein
MSTRRGKRCRHALLLGLSMLVAGAGAQTLEVTRHVVAGGGGHSTGDDYRLSGTAGQAEASSSISGGEFELRGGYWVSAARPGGDVLFRNGFEDP